MQGRLPEEISILVIDDDTDWWKIWQRVLRGQGYHIEFARNPDDALNWLERGNFDLFIVNLLLRDEFSEGWLTDSTLVLEEIAVREGIVVIITGADSKDHKVLYELHDLRQHYEIENIIFKKRVPAYKLREVVQQVLAKRTGHAVVPSQPPPTARPSLTDEQRIRMFTIATCALQGLIEADFEKRPLDRGLESIIRQTEEWFEQETSRSRDESARRTWENFRTQSKTNRDNLINLAMGLGSPEEPALYNLTRQLQQEIEQRKSMYFYDLLAGERYTFNQVEDICTRIDPHLQGLKKNPSHQDMARWLVERARTRKKITCDLICFMLEINPIVLLVTSP